MINLELLNLKTMIFIAVNYSLDFQDYIKNRYTLWGTRKNL